MNKTVLLVVVVLNSVCAQWEKKLLNSGTSPEEKRKIQIIHNKYRWIVATGRVRRQPNATNMMQLCWDEDIAKKAQRIADTMEWGHVPVYDNHCSGKCGQNLERTRSTQDEASANWSKTVAHWFSEMKYYNYWNNSGSDTVGHYKQVVWAETTHVGCGYAYYYDPNDDTPYTKLYVCNYGPSAVWNVNMPMNKQQPYKTGRCGCKGLCEAVVCTPLPGPGKKEKKQHRLKRTRH